MDNFAKFQNFWNKLIFKIDDAIANFILQNIKNMLLMTKMKYTDKEI